MKVLPVNIISAVAASTENANYPADNLLDTHPKKLWKATGATATLTVTIARGSTGFALFNTNATGVSFVLQDPNLIAWETGTDWEAGTDWALIEEGLTVTSITDLDGTSGAVLAEWSVINASITLVVSLVNSSGDVLHAGVSVGGEILEFSDPRYDDFAEEVQDYSIVDQYSNGSTYIKDRDVVRVFTVSSLMDTSTKFDEFMFSVAKVLKSNPAAWMLVDSTDSRWLAYARFTKPPRGEHFNLDHTKLSFELTEVI